MLLVRLSKYPYVIQYNVPIILFTALTVLAVTSWQKRLIAVADLAAAQNPSALDVQSNAAVTLEMEGPSNCYKGFPTKHQAE
ncbi:hypothetical protein [Pelagibaculum spongiae]|uniref:hypothetical protein n=1 Tax=Pelagibaculum spongiae TaxID=2080658 RepID=UPI001057D36F|nr:hypothetical protein [Pelagibaculum spongiae]